ncbi:hypothetical protein NDU88_006531, partial [Pleurodeles waltl]
VSTQLKMPTQQQKRKKAKQKYYKELSKHEADAEKENNGWLSWFGNSTVIFILYKQRTSLLPTDYLTLNLAASDASISVFGYSRGIIDIFNVFKDDGFLITTIWTC